LPSKHNPADSLADILDNTERIEGYVTGMDRFSFEQNGMVRDAVERCLERICEAIYRPGDKAEEILPGLPLGQIRGMGNRLRHAYDRIDLQVMWETVDLRVPELETAARLALAALEAEAGGPHNS
jgi:uncharacterized protein with HEPN domain